MNYNKRRFKRINPDYTIDFCDDGERTLYTRENGVSRLYLDGDLDLNSNNRNLANSSENGRIAQKIWLGFLKMKTYKHLHEQIYSLENLILAFKKARKGKTKKGYVIGFSKAGKITEIRKK